MVASCDRAHFTLYYCCPDTGKRKYKSSRVERSDPRHTASTKPARSWAGRTSSATWLSTRFFAPSTEWLTSTLSWIQRAWAGHSGVPPQSTTTAGLWAWAAIPMARTTHSCWRLCLSHPVSCWPQSGWWGLTPGWLRQRARRRIADSRGRGTDNSRSTRAWGVLPGLDRPRTKRHPTIIGCDRLDWRLC